MVFTPSYVAMRNACCEAAASAKPDPGVEAAGIIPLPGYVHTATGEGPVWIEVTYDDAGVRTETYFYRDNNGVTHMTTSNSVGRNDPAPAKQQFVGTFGADFFNPGPLTSGFGESDILDWAIAANAQVRLSDGTSRLVDKTKDFIASIDVDLKPVGADYTLPDGTSGVTTSSNAVHWRGGGKYNLDAGGSSSAGEIRSPDGYYLPIYGGANIIVELMPAGSAVVVSVTIASKPE